jgi:hypothetical protein
MCFVFDFILHTVYTVDACAFTSILSSPSLIDVMYCVADRKSTPAPVAGVDVYFQIYMNFASSQSLETVSNRIDRFRCVFGCTDGLLNFRRILSISSLILIT